MSHEQPVTRSSAETSVTDLEAAMFSNRATSQIEVAGITLTMERNDDGGFTILGPDNAPSSRIFPRTESAPRGYDGHLPFVANEVVMVSNPGPDIVTMVWLAPLDPEAAYADVTQQTLSQGWTLREDADLPAVRVRRRMYVKNHLHREIMIAEVGVVSLISRPGSQGRAA